METIPNTNSVENNDGEAQETSDSANTTDIQETNSPNEETRTKADSFRKATGDAADENVVSSGHDSHHGTKKDADNDNKTDLSQTIPKKKRRRLEKRSFDDGNDDNFVNSSDDESHMQVDVSLTELKRQVLGRDLKVDDGGEVWEDETDAEIRQIRALMNASNANSDDHKSQETTHTKDDEKDDPESTKLAPTKAKQSSSVSLAEKLRKDLMCAICHEVVYPPVALQCGHSFCQPCIDWWFDHDDAGRCPTCRRRSFPGNHATNRTPPISTAPNLALRACVMAMFGPEIVLRLQNRKKARPKGEAGGAHNAGYQVLSELRDETWHYVAVATESGGSSNNPSNSPRTIQVRRSIVLDAEDQRMQLALAVYHKPIKEVGLAANKIGDSRDHRGRFRVELCLLTMEEDEAVDSGFPTSIVSAEDEFFVCGGHHGSSRFLYSYLDVQMKDENGCLSPLARLPADANDGRFKYVLDPAESTGNANTETIRALLFEHSETGLQLDIDLAQLQNRAGGSFMLPPDHSRSKVHRTFSDQHYTDEDLRNNRLVAMERCFDSEEDEEDENHNDFEEDGFLVNDDDSHVEGAFSDEGDASVDEDDACVICKEGGELMICDGGDKHPGCGKSFHAGCVNRSAIPDGDWICQACAEAGGIEAGIVGHEFREPEETANTETDEHASRCDASGDEAHGNVDDSSDVEGTFSDEDQEESGSQTLLNADDEDTSLSQEQQQLDCGQNSVVKPGKKNKSGGKRRFVLEDSDSD